MTNKAFDIISVLLFLIFVKQLVPIWKQLVFTFDFIYAIII
nr:MAG TPA: hypothetical protein [Caudoviricetes sp.]